MGKLSSLPPRLGSLKPRLGPAPGDEAARLRHREQSIAWRKWYHSRRWRELRLTVLVRDAFVCAETGIICAGKYPDPDSPVVDHIRPHRGDEAMFWDPGNLQVLSKAAHDSVKQAEERASARW